VTVPPVIAITKARNWGFIRFNYDAEAVEVVRSVPGRKWNPGEKVWTIPVDMVGLAAARFAEAGYEVLVDGVAYRPSSALTGSTGNPFTALLASLPERLRKPTYRALARVLHPDHGGDHKAMQALNQAMRPAKR
jgi:hypothetical protein